MGLVASVDINEGLRVALRKRRGQYVAAAEA